MNVKQLEEKLTTTKGSEERLELLDQIADWYYDKDEYQQAVVYYQEASRLAPKGNPRACYEGLEGVCYFLLDKDLEAYKALMASKEDLQPDQEDFDPEISGLVHYFLGSLHEYEEKNEESLQCRLEALNHLDALHPDAQWMLLAGLSRNYERTGDLQKAVELNTRALSLVSHDDPEIAYLLESLGTSLYELGEYEQALQYFTQLVDSDPGFERKEEVYFSIGLCYQRMTDYQLALDSYKKLLELKELQMEKNSRCWLHIEIAHCYYRLQEYANSIETVEKALKHPIEDKEDHAEIHSYLVNNYFALGRFSEAVKAGTKTLEISDHFHNIEIMLPNLAMSYHELGEDEKFQFYRDWCNRDFPDLSWTKQLNKL